MSLRFDVDGTDAAWIAESLESYWAVRPSGAEVWRTLCLGPRGFEAYARVLALPDPQYPGQSENDLDEDLVDAARPEIDVVGDTIMALSEYTTTPEDLCFLFWDGWPYDPGLPDEGRVNIGDSRLCAPARGTRTGWLDWAYKNREGGLPPSFVWPADRAWCIAYDVDSHFAGVAATAAAINLLLETSTLDVVRASRDAEPPTYN